MTYRDILNDYKQIISSCHKYECISDTDSGTTLVEGEEIVGNRGRALLNNWSTEMDVIYNTIYAALLTLFIDPDDEFATPDMHYQILNAYADSSRNFQTYDSTTEAFTEHAEYWYVRGNLYDMLPKANEGMYLYRHIDNVRQLPRVCERYEQLWNVFDWVKQETNQNGETVEIPKVRAFWREYYSSFADEINALMNPVSAEKTRFANLAQFLRDYKKVYEDVSAWLSKGDSFITSVEKTSIGEGQSLGDSFSKINSDGFGLYSNSLGTIYSFYVESKRLRDNSHYANEDMGNMYLRKILDSMICMHFDFFNRANTCLEWIKEFRIHYEI